MRHSASMSYPVTLFSCRPVVKFMQLIQKSGHEYMQSRGARAPNELQWLDLNTVKVADMVAMLACIVIVSR